MKSLEDIRWEEYKAFLDAQDADPSLLEKPSHVMKRQIAFARFSLAFFMGVDTQNG